MMEIEELWNEIDARVVCLPSQTAPLCDSMNRVLNGDVLSPVDLPAFDQSSMDGFAFASVEPGSCRVTGRVVAGRPIPIAVENGSAVRIFTGGVVPEGTVAIAKQEDCEVRGGLVSLRPGVRLEKGMHIRRRGGVFRAGEVILNSGAVISPGAVALLASAGIRAVNAVRQASALHIATGDEIVESGKELLAGQTYNSNGPMIAALLKEAGQEGASKLLGDDSESLCKEISDFAGDLLLVSGGSGPGDHDHTKSALESAGYVIHCSQINSRPGKPLVFATRGAQVAFGLPGNPLSHWVCFQAFVNRAIRRLHGLPEQVLQSARFVASLPDSDDGRRTWTPGVVEMQSDGATVLPLPWKHSGDLTPLACANALIFGSPKQGVAQILIL